MEISLRRRNWRWRSLLLLFLVFTLLVVFPILIGKFILSRKSQSIFGGWIILYLVKAITEGISIAEGKRLVDVGNIECLKTHLEQAQQQSGDAVTDLLTKEMTPIILGSGHETAYGHYLVVRKFISKDTSLVIINNDAHFDLRSYDEQTSSGTMFKQILDNDKKSHVRTSNYGCPPANQLH